MALPLALGCGLTMASMTASLRASLITITNPTFAAIQYANTNYNFYNGWITGWSGNDTATESSGAAAYFANGGSPVITQAPSVNTIAIQPGTYSIGFDAVATFGGSDSLTAGFVDSNGDNLSADNGAITFTNSSFVTYGNVATLAVPAGSPLISPGNDLGFFISNPSDSNWPGITNVTLNFTSVPEPAMSGFVGLGAMGTLLLRRRRPQ
ncbi:MAG: PEP-CTERM sorting domain-containing protein [Phycisphaerales bacterium]|nr:PEP-CTERM sorting domain-containing protein [Phycisphaerales bacterium]